MQNNIGSGIDEQGGPWAQSIFKVIDDLIEHDLTSENRVFAIGVGVNGTPEIFDIIGTLQEIEKLEMGIDEKEMHEVLTGAKSISYLLRHNEKRRHINAIVDILKKNGARNIRQWIRDIALIEDEVSDKMAEVTLKEFESNEEFREKFVYDFLPSTCRDSDIVKAAQIIPILGSGLSWMEDVTVRQCSNFRSATREDIHEVKKKAKSYVLKDVQIAMRHFFKKVENHSIFSVQDASRIIRGCVDEEELSTKRKKELLENVEPFIYGKTPLYESLEEAAELLERDNSENKMLFVLSDGMPTDGSNEDNVKIRQITSELEEAGIKVVSCFVTRSTGIDPKRLYDTIQPRWESGANFLFSLSSHVPTQHLPRAILAKQGWTIDIVNNETRLFVQVNHPKNLRYITFRKA